ncbi:hypothetical protein [Pelagibacterium lentulum]|uniref:Uncharacterized protein n=1 Tax=Pelagibacterium lentulum TaxID=2029865 RepID=A0A916W0T9_9HYPH|nr:hypothetical protein [Pelagibacterium lentulum]GGA57154.1 hypothetical protein GCM10011499_29250 [Pelagibacterium lentulum]
MKRQIAYSLGFAAAICCTLLAMAQNDIAQAYVTQNGFEAVDPDKLWKKINAALAPSDPDATIFHPTADIGPVPMAMLAVASQGSGPDRVRYRISYGIAWIDAPPSAAALPLSFMEVQRFNVGPAIREDLVQSLGADAVAPIEEFGVGPHVAWRLVTQPVMGNRAIISAAGYAEISEDAASAALCFGRPCLSPNSVIEGDLPWSEMEEAPISLDVPFAVSANGVLTPFAAAEILLGDVEPEGPDGTNDGASIPEPVIEAVIEGNLGQDIGLEAAYRWGGLLDDSVAAIWERLASLGMMEDRIIYRASTYECARGPDFPEPGQFCP